MTKLDNIGAKIDKILVQSVMSLIQKLDRYMFAY
jgi:hypothetical protein